MKEWKMQERIKGQKEGKAKDIETNSNQALFWLLSQMAEILAAHNEREAAKMQKELDNVKEELEEWKTKYDEICVELEQTFNSMAGY